MTPLAAGRIKGNHAIICVFTEGNEYRVEIENAPSRKSPVRSQYSDRAVTAPLLAEKSTADSR